MPVFSVRISLVFSTYVLKGLRRVSIEKCKGFFPSGAAQQGSRPFNICVFFTHGSLSRSSLTNDSERVT